MLRSLGASIQKWVPVMLWRSHGGCKHEGRRDCCWHCEICHGKWSLPKVLVAFIDLAGCAFVLNWWCCEMRCNESLVGRCVWLLKTKEQLHATIGKDGGCYMIRHDQLCSFVGGVFILQRSFHATIQLTGASLTSCQAVGQIFFLQKGTSVLCNGCQAPLTNTSSLLQSFDFW
jgi:hypothetical protein